MNAVFFNGWGFSSNHLPACANPKINGCCSENSGAHSIDTVFSVDTVFSSSKEIFLENIVEEINSCDKPQLIIGWSLGGMLALECASRLNHHQKESLLVLISSSGNFTAQEAKRIRSLNKLKSNLQELIEGLNISVLKSFYDDLVKEYQLYDVSGPDIFQLLKEAASLDYPALLKALQYLETNILDTYAKNCKVKTVLIHGENDLLIPAEHSKTLASKISSAEVHIIPNSGHMIPFTHSEEIISIINDSLNSLTEKVVTEHYNESLNQVLFSEKVAV